MYWFVKWNKIFNIYCCMFWCYLCSTWAKSWTIICMICLFNLKLPQHTHNLKINSYLRRRRLLDYYSCSSFIKKYISMRNSYKSIYVCITPSLECNAYKHKWLWNFPIQLATSCGFYNSVTPQRVAKLKWVLQ